MITPLDVYRWVRPAQPAAAPPEPVVHQRPAPVPDLVEPDRPDVPVHRTTSASCPPPDRMPPLDGCAWCDMPPEQHGRDGLRYSALCGYHPWTEPNYLQTQHRRDAHARTRGDAA